MTVRVTSVKSTASAQGILKIGDSVTFTVALNRPVEVSGLPMLITSEGYLAVYMPGLSANPQELVFRYAATRGDSSPDLTIVGITTNGSNRATACSQTIVGANRCYRRRYVRWDHKPPHHHSINRSRMRVKSRIRIIGTDSGQAPRDLLAIEFRIRTRTHLVHAQLATRCLPG
jgi:hypothetical protein